MSTAVWTHQLTDDQASGTTGQTARTFAAGTVGDLRVLAVLTESSTIHVSSLSGGGVTTWTRAGSVNAVSSGTFGAASEAELWYGRVTSSGTALTITYSATIGSTPVQTYRMDFRSSNGGSNITFAANGFVQTGNTTSSSPWNWPSLTTTRAGQLVVGAGWDNGPTGGTSSGSSTGYTYVQDSNQNYHLYRLVTAASEAESPTVTFTGTNGWASLLVIFDDEMISVSDAGFDISDNATITATTPAADAAAGADTAAITAVAVGLDSWSGADVGAIRISASDSGAGVDAAIVRATLPTAETGAGADAAAVTAKAITADTGSGADTATIRATVPVTDTGLGTDTMVADHDIVSVADTGHGTDNAIVIARFPATDSAARPAVDWAVPDTHGIVVGPRVFYVYDEDRNILVLKDNRTLTVPEEDRVYIVQEDPDVNKS